MPFFPRYSEVHAEVILLHFLVRSGGDLAHCDPARQLHLVRFQRIGSGILLSPSVWPGTA